MPYKLKKTGKGYKVQTKSGPHKGRVHLKKALSRAKAIVHPSALSDKRIRWIICAECFMVLDKKNLSERGGEK